ncbi:MAG: hypothetical protein IPO58_05615 [Betaproteobacteria bacterium]|nr:hypothetical protein [Betaproteobacteria bacterium]
MIRATNIRNGLTCTVSAMSLGVLIGALAGCAGAEKQMYVDWIAVSNPDVVCAGKPDCVRRSTYKGKDLCTIITANKDVSYSRLGEQVRGCLK